MAFTTLDCFQITGWEWPNANGGVTVIADGELTVTPWDPQDEVTLELHGVTCEIEVDSLGDMPTSAAEIAELLGPDPVWYVPGGND
jgi:non-ribosomal peptide synthetase component F